MEQGQGFQIIKEYLRRKSWGLGLGILSLLVFAALFSLYRLPMEPLVYGAVLSASLTLAYLAMDFGRFARRHRLLMQLRQSALHAPEQLPAPADLLEAGYQALTSALLAEKARREAELRQSLQDMEEYYTLWVHQVKTPIAAAHLLLQTGGGGENAAELELELFKIERYVEMVLQYLRLESPSADLVIRRCSLDGIVRQAVRRYAPLFIRKRISLSYEGVELEILTDAKWLGFVLEQLLANALQYTPQGHIAIYLDQDDPNTLVIADTGIGIAAEDLPRIFEKGYTGYTGRAQKYSSGLGLYLCKRILDKLGHTIRVESQVGAGTKVKIRFAEVKPFLE